MWIFLGGLFAGLVSGLALGAIFGVWLTGDDEKEHRSDFETDYRIGGYGLSL